MRDPSNVDSDLVEPAGILGAEATGEQLKKLNFKYVWVSPLVRTMKTAIHMFKGHPNLANIQFIVEPMIRAIHTTTQNMNTDVVELMQRYAPGEPACCGLNFDFSKITGLAEPQLWNVNTVINPSKKQQIIDNLSRREGGATFANVHATMLELLCKELPDGAFETEDLLYERA